MVSSEENMRGKTSVMSTKPTKASLDVSNRQLLEAGVRSIIIAFASMLVQSYLPDLCTNSH